MNLPPELIDEIIRNLASDVRSLRNCSLVARSWTYPSRKWLFKYVLVSKDTQQLWLSRISPTNVGLLRNIRSFTYVFDPCNGRTRTTHYLIDPLCPYLPSFRRLRRLGLHSALLGVEVPQKIGLFSAFQHSLSSLSFNGCRVTPSALITLINHFPLLARLALRHLTCEADGEPIPELSRPLRGTLRITNCRTLDLALFDKLSNPPPELGRLILRQVQLSDFYECIVGAQGGSVKYLKMDGHGVRGRERTS